MDKRAPGKGSPDREPSTCKGKGVGLWLVGKQAGTWVGLTREGIDIFLSLLATPVDPLCTLTLEGVGRGFWT